MDAQEFWFESVGTRLFATQRGEGPTVVFIHGGMADHRAALYRAGALSSSYRLVTPDVRGAGRSCFRGELGWEQLAADVAALLDHLGQDRAVVGGTSAGSSVALAFALRHPTRVEALVVASPIYGERLTAAQRTAFDRMDRAGRRALEEGIEAILPLYDALPPSVREKAVEMARAFDTASVAATNRFLARGEAPFSDLRELSAVTSPTLVVRGSDPEHPPEIAELYAEYLPAYELADPTADLAGTISDFLGSMAIDREGGA